MGLENLDSYLNVEDHVTKLRAPSLGLLVGKRRPVNKHREKQRLRLDSEGLNVQNFEGMYYMRGHRKQL